MREGDYVAIYDSRTTIRAIGVVTGVYEYKGEEDGYHHTRPVRWLDQQVREIWELNGNTQLVEETIYELWRIMPSKLAMLLPDSPHSNNEEPYVLIIDEINRGNISRIFGELITLLEPDKRLGAPNELSVRLPYSKKTFAVPSNLYIIGTMNTADRSIALLDVALRRRFEFEEMMPDVEVIQEALNENVEAEGSELSTGQLDMICSVFEILNARITALLDRVHQIGHSYFLGIASIHDLRDTLYRRVFPLLQEYFYNDPERLERLLGVYNENEHSGFIGQTAGEYGKGFRLDDEVDERPWSFHEYEAEELESALRNTFLNE
jgi:5-methylcytosine-specific restriction protein B